MQEYINMLSPNLRFLQMESNSESIVFDVESTLTELKCPYCGMESSRCHSKYEKTFDDLPLSGKLVTIRVHNRKMFCENPECDHKTFSETFDFVKRRAKKTNRLVKYIVDTSTAMSSLTAQILLRNNGVKIGKSTICTFLKKNIE